MVQSGPEGRASDYRALQSILGYDELYNLSLARGKQRDIKINAPRGMHVIIGEILIHFSAMLEESRKRDHGSYAMQPNESVH